jgi:hypothetical protein
VPVTTARDTIRDGARIAFITHDDTGEPRLVSDLGPLTDGARGRVQVIIIVAHHDQHTHHRRSGPAGMADLVDTLLDDLGVAEDLAHQGTDVTSPHAARTANRNQRLALAWLYPTCADDGCDITHGLEADHDTTWAERHETHLANLRLRCPFHHDRKTHHDEQQRRTRERDTREDERAQRPAPDHEGQLPLVC